jgi:Kef-type K+ transport system membrane component KefB
LSHAPVFWILLAGVAAPLLGELPLGFKVPVVVLEVLLGVVIGPHVLRLVPFEGFVSIMFTIGMASTLFMAGMELDFSEIRGRPLSLACGGWALSVLVSLAAVALLHAAPHVDTPMMVALALCTTGLGVLVPIFRDSDQLGTRFGRFVLAAGTLGEVGPIVAMSLLLSQHYSSWQEAGYLLIFLAIIAAAVLVGVRARPPRLLGILDRHMHKSTQMPVRISLLVLTALLLLAERFGFESIFGAFAAGMVLGQATRGAPGKHLREKLETVCFSWFYPFFFVGTGIKFDVAALGRNATTLLLVPGFALIFLLVRGVPVLIYRRELSARQSWPFALSTALPSLSIIVVITEIGTRAGTLNSDVATALIGAALLCVLVYPTLAGALLGRGGGGRSKWETYDVPLDESGRQ